MPRIGISHSEPSFFPLFPYFFALAWLFVPAYSPAAQTVYPASTQSNPLDNTNDAARSAAMGSAFTGVADDASALFANPAGLAFLTQGQLFLNSDFWLVGTFQETALAGFPAGGLGGFAFAAHYLDYGQIGGRDELGNVTASYGADQWGLVAGWGMEALRDFSVGTGIQVSQTTLAGSGYTDFSSDFGVLWKEGGWGLGASYFNMGWVAPGGPSEAVVNLGASFETALDPASRLLTALGGVIDPSAVDYFQAGLEYSLQGRLFLRVGCDAPLSGNNLGGLTDLTAGVGFVFSDFHLDYAYLPYGDLGAAQHACVGYFFGGGPPQGSPAAKAPQGRTSGFPAKPLPGAGTPGGKLPGSSNLPSASTVPPLPPALAAGPAGLGGGPGTSPAASPVPSPAAASTPGANGGASASQSQASNPSGAKDSLVVQFDLEDNPAPSGAELEKEGKYREALDAYLSALRQNPKDAGSWWGLGYCYWQLGQKTYAVQCFQQVLQLQPDNQNLADWLKQNQSPGP